MVMPIELSLCAANGLSCTYPPVIQGYSAYSPFLDQWNAAIFLSSERAPQYVVLGYNSIDGRLPWFDMPATWRAVATHYRFVARDPVGEWALLERRSTPVPVAERTRASVEARVGEWVQVPDDAALMVAVPHLSLSAKGALAKLLFRLPPIEIDLESTTGDLFHFRLVAATAGQGLMIGRVPITSEDVVRLLEGNQIPAMARFRIVGPGARYLRPTFVVEWKALEMGDLLRGLSAGAGARSVSAAENLAAPENVRP
jgi:hypothetical protein